VAQIGIILKGLDGVVEVVGGLLLLAVTPVTVDGMVVRATQHELSEDPNDVLAGRLLGYTHGLTGSPVTFAARYLLVHGVVKIVLVAAQPSVGVPRDDRLPGHLALGVFDALMVWLTSREWRRNSADRASGIRNQRPPAACPR
jgi:uncharacterized membrane protein